MDGKKRITEICIFAGLSIVFSMIVTIAAGHGIGPFGLILISRATHPSSASLLANWFFFSTLVAFVLIITGIVAMALFRTRNSWYISGRILIDIGVLLLSTVIIWFISKGEGVGKGLGVFTSIPFFVVAGFAILRRASPPRSELLAHGFPVDVETTRKTPQGR